VETAVTHDRARARHPVGKIVWGAAGVVGAAALTAGLMNGASAAGSRAITAVGFGVLTAPPGTLAKPISPPIGSDPRTQPGFDARRYSKGTVSLSLVGKRVGPIAMFLVASPTGEKIGGRSRLGAGDVTCAPASCDVELVLQVDGQDFPGTLHDPTTGGALIKTAVGSPSACQPGLYVCYVYEEYEFDDKGNLKGKKVVPRCYQNGSRPC
jgi:hypothetical protein